LRYGFRAFDAQTGNSPVIRENSLLGKERCRGTLLLKPFLNAGKFGRSYLPPFGMGAFSDGSLHQPAEQVYHGVDVLGSGTGDRGRGNSGGKEERFDPSGHRRPPGMDCASHNRRHFGLQTLLI
jgi:hypothetical protein